MDPQEHAAITDSPWFWVLAFSLMALAALAAMSGKYGQRQAIIERQYQARERGTAEANDSPAAGEAERRPYASSGDTLVPLWPLAGLLVVAAIVAGTMLYRGQRRAITPLNESPPS